MQSSRTVLIVLLALIASKAVSASDAELALGKKLFSQGTTPPCAACHTLKDANATGAIGPILDEIKPDTQRIISVLRSGLGVMPAFTSLSDTEMQAIARYVSTVAGK